MKFAAAIIALAAVAAAAPGADSTQNRRCTPGTYACNFNDDGWLVCNTSGQFVNGGSCPPRTVCKFDQANQSPYCVPPNFQFP